MNLRFNPEKMAFNSSGDLVFADLGVFYSKISKKAFGALRRSGIKCWRLSGHEEPASIRHITEFPVYWKTFDPYKTRFLITSHENPKTFLVNLQNLDIIESYPTENYKNQIFSPDGETLIGYDNTHYSPNLRLGIKNVGDKVVSTIEINIPEINAPNSTDHAYFVVNTLKLTEQGQLLGFYHTFSPFAPSLPKIFVCEFWLVELIGQAQKMITLADWHRVQTALTDGGQLLPAERHWLEFCQELLNWKFRHEVEIDLSSPIAPEQFDIQL